MPHIKEMMCCFVLDIIMTFTAAVVMSAFAAPVYMVFCRIRFFLSFRSVISWLLVLN